MKQDRWFSVIMAIAMLCIGLVSIFNPMDYFKHIADAVVFPLFLFTILETVGHIRNSLFQNLEFELMKATTDEKWLKGYYKFSKDGETEEDKRIQKEYDDLLVYISRLDQMKMVFEKWFRFYNKIYILFGAFLILSALLANLECIINISSKINVTAVTLFTLVIFVSEPWIVETASNKLGFMAVKKI